VATGDLITLLSNASSIVVFCALLAAGIIVPRERLDEMRSERDAMRAERDEWKRTAELDRVRGDAGVLAAQAARDILKALQRASKEPE